MARIVNATDMIISFQGVVIGCAQATTLTVARAIDAATCTASGAWAQGSAGQKSWNTSVTALFRTFDTNQQAGSIDAFDVFDLLDDGTEVEVEYGQNGANDKRWKGKALISNFSVDKPETGNVTWKSDLTGNGPLEVVTVATPLTVGP